MQEIKNESAIAHTGSAYVTAAQFIVLLMAAIFAPAINVQLLTGTLVNATLFLGAVLIGVPAAILIGIIPSLVSSVTGLLPAVMLPMVPFIILGNAVLIVIFAVLRKRSYFRAVILASLAKFALLSSVSSFVIGYFVPAKVASNLAVMMSYPQLLTALSGGMLAYAVLGILKKAD